MGYQVLARKWRPQTFDQIVGQEHVTTTLANALAKDRVAHAYLFTGPRGCGKTTMARLLAKALNCDDRSTPSPCGSCESCQAVAAGTMLDVMEIDAASNTGVDNIRELRENAQYQPSAGKKRVFIIDEVHMLSKGAFNALLKTLEEPPAHVHFIFATTEPVKIPRTILSRCQRFDFRLFRLDELNQRLSTITTEEGVDIDPAAVELLASMAEGSMRDALSLLDQAISSREGRLDKDGVIELFGLVGHESYVELNTAILARDPRAALDLIDGLVNAGHDLVEFGRGLVANFRDLLLLRLDPELASRVEKPEAVKAELATQAAAFEAADLLHLAQRSAELFSQLERAPQPRWLMEAFAVEMATLESRVLLSELLGALQAGTPLPVAAKVAPPPPKRPPAAATATRPAARSAATPPPTQAASPPPPKPESPSPAPSRPASADAAREEYQRWVARVREENLPLGSMLVEAAPQIDGSRLRLQFRAEHAFHRDQVGDRKHLAWLSGLAGECFGRPMEIEAVCRPASEAEEELRRSVQEKVAPTQRQALEREMEKNPELGRLVEGLGGKLDGGPDVAEPGA